MLLIFNPTDDRVKLASKEAILPRTRKFVDMTADEHTELVLNGDLIEVVPGTFKEDEGSSFDPPDPPAEVLAQMKRSLGIED